MAGSSPSYNSNELSEVFAWAAAIPADQIRSPERGEVLGKSLDTARGWVDAESVAAQVMFGQDGERQAFTFPLL